MVLVTAPLWSGCPADTGSENDSGPPPPGVANLVINEVMAANTSAVADENGEFDDWIEIWNPSDGAIALSGYSLSDDPLEPQKFVFDDAIPPIQADGYEVIFADKDLDQGPRHADFRLSKDGEGVYLYAPDGRLVSEIGFGVQFDDISFGLPNNEGPAGYLLTPTPNRENSGLRTTIPDGGTAEPDPVVDSGVIDGGVDPEDAGLPPAAENVVINELLVINTSGIQDQASEYEPWIELLNLGPTVSLRGHALKDSRELASRWFFPDDTEIAAGEYLLLFADQDPVGGNDHADIEVLPAGGEVSLIAPDGSTLDTLVFGAQAADVSLGRIPNGTGEFVETLPTPRADNAVFDAGVSDAGVSDAGVSDAGVSDAGVSDAGAGDDAGVNDAGANDAGAPDAGT